METNECFVYISNNSYWGNNNSHIYQIPCYPDEVSDSVSVNWSETSIIGRSPILAYNSTGLRNISFSMDLHREMYHGYQGAYPDVIGTEIDVLLKSLRAAAYPIYSSSGLKPPMVMFKFGDLRMKGIIRSVSFQWKKPIVNKQYNICSVSITMDEITDPKHSEGDTLGSAENPNRLTDNSTAEWIEI